MIEQIIATYVVPFLQMAALKYPVIFSVVAIMGIARAMFKPIMTLIETYVSSTASTSDDEKLAEIKASKWFGWLVFFVDYVLSIKLNKPKE